jgi:hypothetical protein
MAHLADVRRNALLALVPPPRLALSQWIERNLRPPEGVSAKRLSLMGTIIIIRAATMI